MILTRATPCLSLRAMRPDDWPAYAGFMAGPRSAHMGRLYDTPGTWGLFCHGAAGWPLFGAGAPMMEHQNETVVPVGISHGPRFPEPERGWVLYEGADGRGHAVEAAAALRDWAFALGFPTPASYVDPANAPSARVAGRLGARIDPDAVPQDPGDLVYRRPRPA